MSANKNENIKNSKKFQFSKARETNTLSKTNKITINNPTNFFNKELNLNQVNQKIKLEKINSNGINYKKNSSDELLVLAFDPDEEFPLPENYIIDELNEDSINFLRKAKEEESNLQSKILQSDNIKDHKVDKIISHDLQIYQTEEVIFNINVNNNDVFEKNYIEFNININWKDIILHEFKYLNSFFSEAKSNKNIIIENHIFDEEQKDYFSFIHLSNLNQLKKQNLTSEDIIKEYKLQIENINNIKAPTSDNMTTFLALKLNNKNIIKLIKHFSKQFTEKKNIYNILMWAYMLLSFLQLPLIDDDNSILYALNKNIKSFIKTCVEEETKTQNLDDYDKDNMITSDYCILQKKNDLITAKIIYIIISEFFNQKIL